MKKIAFGFLSLICIFCLTGCSVEEFGTAFENFLKNNNSAVRSTEVSSVEGHIKNVEYGLMQIELKGSSSNFSDINTREDLMNLFKSYGVKLPATDTIVCKTYKIVKVNVAEATGCTDMGTNGEKNLWNGRTYTYQQGKHAMQE